MGKFCCPSEGFKRDDVAQERERALFQNVLQSPAEDGASAIEEFCKEVTGGGSASRRPNGVSFATIGGVQVRRTRRTSCASTHSMKAFQLMSGVIEEAEEDSNIATTSTTMRSNACVYTPVAMAA